MRQIILLLTLVGAILIACTGVVLAQQASPERQAAKHLAPPGQAKKVCDQPAKPGKASCHAKVRTDANPSGASPADAPTGYWPYDLQSAYNLANNSSTNGIGKTVAIVGAYDNSNAEKDLQTYRTQFNLPTCTSDNGCFKKIDQRGGTNYPSPNSGWASEISLDLDMVSAICPNCNILLIEADDNSFNNLSAAVDTAASYDTVTGKVVPSGVNPNPVAAISNSYGGPEFSSEASYEGHYNHPGIAVTVSSGDRGYGVEFPSVSQFVTAVGGTRLTNDSSTRGWSETVWGSGSTSSTYGGTGSGCSAYISKPSWQTDTGCSRRTVADIAAVADPNTGVAVYDGGWKQFGGTSAAAPIIASIYALAGGNYSNSYPYSHTSSLNDVTSGSNGTCGGYYVTRKRHGHKSRVFVPVPSYLCTGVTGYDGPTGNGTPNGTGAF